MSHIARAQKVHGIQSSIKNISGKIITALYLALLCILFAQMASAQIPLASSFGYWSDAKNINGNDPPCLYYNDDHSIVRNGIPAGYSNCPTTTGHDLQSGFGFVGVKNASVIPCKRFEVGTFTHYNRPIYSLFEGTRIFNMVNSTMNLKLTFSSGISTITKTFTFVMELDETRNTDRFCPDDCEYKDLEGFTCAACFDVSGSGGPCPDYVAIPDASSSQIVTINGESYILEIIGFKKSEDDPILPYFITSERCDNSAKLYAKLVRLSCISGYKYDICGQPLSEWQIEVFNSSTGESMGTATTDATGYWQVCNLLPGSYTITETIKPGWINSNLSQNVVVLECENKTGVNFWNTPLLCISGFKKDACTGEGIKGWLITINNSTGYSDTIETNSTGYYEFCDLLPGDYTLTELSPDGYISTTPVSL
ncbi:MAG: choice-of-anchor K domain-containing protein, partial [Methanothrix sp.]